MLAEYWLLAVAALFVTSTYAGPRPASDVAGHVVHEKRGESHNWIRSNRLDASAILPVRVGLVQTNLDKGHDLLMELSHPDSPKYGQWWTPEEVHDFFAPAANAVAMVKSWIESTGIASHRIVHHDNKGWLAVDATVEEAELLLKTTFYEYQHSQNDALSVGADSYYIPEHLAGHIDYVTPGARLVSVQKRDKHKHKSTRHVRQPASHLIQPLGVRGRPAGDAGGDHLGRSASGSQQLDPSLRNCSSEFTLACIRALYHIPESHEAVCGNELGIFATGDWFDKADLDQYFAKYAPNVPQGTYPVPALIDGAVYDKPQNDTDHVQEEAVADISLSTGLIYPQKVVIYQVDDAIYSPRFDDPNYTWGYLNTFLDALDGSYCTYSAYGETGNDPKLDPVYPNPNPAGYQGKLMCGVFKPTKVISLSYMADEAELPRNYQRRQCDEFLKLGLMGTTIVAASGDNGVQGSSNIGGGCLGPKRNIFNPGGPGTCPYILSIGGTMTYGEQTILDRESAMSTVFEDFGNFSSGGGFSNIFPRPSYQDEAVQHYLDNYAPSYPSYEELNPDFYKVHGLYNRIGRAYPDVSAYGFRLPFVAHGDYSYFSGTSCATPLFASILTLLNQERAKIGKSSIGFVHPVLYSHPEIFTDIVNGTNPGCGTEGFNASPRYETCSSHHAIVKLIGQKWDALTGLGTPIYPKMRDLFLSLP